MNRTPVTLNRPSCFSFKSSKNDYDCEDCPHQTRCAKVERIQEKQMTVEEWINKLSSGEDADDELPGTHETFKLFCKLFREVGGNISDKLSYSKRWRNTIDAVIAACTTNNVPVEVYLRAQVDTIGRWAVRNKKPFYSNMLMGKNAQKRFEEWMERNKRKYSDHHFIPDPEKNRDLAGEMFFAETFFEGAPLKLAARETKKRFKGWSIQKGRGNPLLRLHALSAFLMSRNPVLPNRITLSDANFRWGTVRKEVLRIIGERG